MSRQTEEKIFNGILIPVKITAGLRPRTSQTLDFINCKLNYRNELQLPFLAPEHLKRSKGAL